MASERLRLPSQLTLNVLVPNLYGLVTADSLSILTAIFQVYLGQPVFIEAKDD